MKVKYLAAPSRAKLFLISSRNTKKFVILSSISWQSLYWNRQSFGNTHKMSERLYDPKFPSDSINSICLAAISYMERLSVVLQREYLTLHVLIISYSPQSL